VDLSIYKGEWQVKLVPPGKMGLYQGLGFTWLSSAGDLKENTVNGVVLT